jgi:YjbE family integral membrane protein
MWAWVIDSQFWLGLAEIIGINIILSGDNAVVIALACRTLPPNQQRWAILLGTAGAIILRVILTAFAAVLLDQAWLKLAGSVLLLWIAVKLLVPENDDDGAGDDSAGLIAAIRTIIIADLVMSLDNVIGVAAAAKGHIGLLVIGLVISMPLIIFGSTVILKLMNRFPWIVTLGGALLGFVAGDMAVTDRAVVAWINAQAAWLHTVVPALCAVLVVIVGKWLAARVAVSPVDVAASGEGSNAEP